MRSRLLNLNLISSERVDTFVSSLGKKLRAKMCMTYRVVVANALASWEWGVYYHRYKGAPTLPQQYNMYLIDNQSIIKVVDELTHLGYLENHIAPRDTRKWNRQKEKSSFIPTKKLLAFFTEDDVQYTKTVFNQTHEGVIMRDGNKHEIPYTDTPSIVQMRKIVNALNEMNDESLFTHNGKVICGSGMVRIFNEDFEQGGRWYRCSAQNIRQHDAEGNRLPLHMTRLGIQIDHHPVVEVDYSCLHPMLLCALRGIPAEGFYGDVYGRLLPKHFSEQDRQLVKVVVNIMFNARSQASAISAISKELSFPKNKGTQFVDAQSLFKTVWEGLVPFQPYFCQERCTGLWLQNIDSKITEVIVKEFIKHEQPILLIHDSFIVEEHNLELLQNTMERAFRLVTRSVEWEVPVKISYCDGVVEKALLGNFIGADMDSLCYDDEYLD